MKYTKTVEATQYRPGMEDGFDTRYYDSANPTVTFLKPVNVRCIKTEVPYLHSFVDGDLVAKNFILDDDWIITDAKGTRTLCSAEEFEELYEPV